MNNYLITIFKPNDSLEYHTLACASMHLASMQAVELLKMQSQYDAIYDNEDLRVRVSEIKAND